jgi:hypothetical protein
MTPASLTNAGGLVLVCPVADVLNLSARCGWLFVNADGDLCPSERGQALRQFANFQERLREQLSDVIASLHPAWSKVLIHGRHELARFAPADVCQCFKEAGLFTMDPTETVVRCWDELANLARGIRSAAALAVGRTGERLSIKYEQQRTQRKPIWQSIESSHSGYDLLSVVSAADDTRLQIEVKASELRLKEAFCFLTHHEWQTAELAQAHSFHLWYVGTHPQLAVVPIQEFAPHVPSNNGNGEWQSAKVPFRAFLPLFQPVSLLP